jgi:serine/threonine-protein kinase RsbW
MVGVKDARLARDGVAPSTYRTTSAGLRADLPSELREVEGLCREAGLLLERNGLGDCIFAVDLLLREFTNNSMIHGNRLASGKRVRVSLRILRRWIVVRIADEGPGFDWRARGVGVPDEKSTSGRGLPIGAAYARHLRFNPTGNRVALWIETTG